MSSFHQTGTQHNSLAAASNAPDNKIAGPVKALEKVKAISTPKPVSQSSYSEDSPHDGALAPNCGQRDTATPTTTTIAQNAHQHSLTPVYIPSEIADNYVPFKGQQNRQPQRNKSLDPGYHPMYSQLMKPNNFNLTHGPEAMQSTAADKPNLYTGRWVDHPPSDYAPVQPAWQTARLQSLQQVPLQRGNAILKDPNVPLGQPTIRTQRQTVVGSLRFQNYHGLTTVQQSRTSEGRPR
ncbi:hypothetical protein T440DRAFT_518503 [Plenodomus tracheiphilus IPT5]|uniref:Uncharacterized protein n=1 Tax=Plenodomus tracheiphilus IPT5 TaxID=1408161 RepID=A0A6A7B3E7_9PLEO|nr:hypothetical protein T440DRAFT_518503 [Plenodomus tracheiphilus IPT5]